MTELLFVVCLLAEPMQCQHRSLVYTEISPMQCLRGAQPELAKWTLSHPGHSIQSWKCQTVYSDQKA